MPDRYDGDFIHAADPHIESGHRADAIGLFRLIALLRNYHMAVGALGGQGIERGGRGLTRSASGGVLITC